MLVYYSHCPFTGSVSLPPPCTLPSLFPKPPPEAQTILAQKSHYFSFYEISARNNL